MRRSPLYPMLVILTVLLVRLAGFVSTGGPSPLDADSPSAVCRFNSAPVVYRPPPPPRGRVELSVSPSVDWRPDMALRLRPKPRGRVCERSAASPRRIGAEYLDLAAPVFRRYTLQHHQFTHAYLQHMHANPLNHTQTVLSPKYS